MTVVHPTLTGSCGPDLRRRHAARQLARAHRGRDRRGGRRDSARWPAITRTCCAEEAGILLGFHEGGLDEPRAKATAQLLIAAGADESLIPGWIEEGRHRAETRPQPPFSSPARRAPRHP